MRWHRHSCLCDFFQVEWAEQADTPTKSHSEESLCHLTQVHYVTGELEIRVKETFPQIARVTIHPKPVEGR